MNPAYVPGVLCTNHGPFAWGKDAEEAVHNAVVMEEVAKMAARTEQLKTEVGEAPKTIQDKHFSGNTAPMPTTETPESEGLC